MKKQKTKRRKIQKEKTKDDLEIQKKLLYNNTCTQVKNRNR